ncbi:MAG TPA: translocation/assembly module TamB domain-containing protein, partial [Candidatus Binatia bacterium]|nr:translocation/assembly module TamB domain-containing protein [Candidatus Binatia bacterium]
RFTLEQGGSKLDGAASFSIAKNITDVEGSVEAGPSDRLRARYQVVEHTKISGEIEGKSQELGRFGVFVGLRLEGAGGARVDLVGTVEHPLLRGEADFARLTAQGVTFGAVRGPFEISRDGFRSSTFNLADGQIQVSGQVALTAAQQNEWSASIHGASLGRATPALKLAWPTFPDLGGKADGTVQASGPWPSLDLGARLQLAEAAVAGEQLGQGSVDASRSAGRWTARADFRRPDGAASMLRMALEPDGRLAVDVAASDWRLEWLEAVHGRMPDLAGDVALQGSLAGSASRPRGDVSLAFSNLRLESHALGDGSLRARTDGRRATIDATLGEAIHVSGETDLGLPYGFHARAECHRFDVGPFVPSAPGVTIRLEGTAELRGDIRQPLEQGSARIAAITIERGAQKLENPAPIVIQVAKGAVDVLGGELTGAGQRVVVGGRWTPEEAEVRASASGNLELLEALSSTVASARGRVEAEVRASRHGDESWRYRGRARLDGGTLDLAFLVGVTDVSGEIVFEERKLDLRELTGKLGGGEFLIGGTLGLDSGWDLGWAIRDASLGLPSWLDYRASGNGRLLGSIAAPELSGEIEVDQAIYDRRIEWADFLPWFRKQATPRRAAALPLGLDLHIVADGGLYVDNNLAKAEMRADMRIHGGREQPVTWNGSIEVLSGEFVFRRRRFTITSGSVVFQGDRPTNPDLEFSGETRVDTRDADYAIQVRVSGTADSPRIQFTADDPTLTENDVLALVTFGRTVSQLQSQGAGIDLSEVLALTTGPQARKVEERIHTFFPVDRIEVEPSFSRVSGANEPRLRIAKDLSERLSAVIGTGLGSERRQDVGLEYQVTRRFSLQGVWGSQTKNQAGAFGGDLKFHVPFRTLPTFSLLPSCPLSHPGEP